MYGVGLNYQHFLKRTKSTLPTKRVLLKMLISTFLWCTFENLHTSVVLPLASYTPLAVVSHTHKDSIRNNH
jgi:hypothetical protein